MEWWEHTKLDQPALTAAILWYHEQCPVVVLSNGSKKRPKEPMVADFIDEHYQEEGMIFDEIYEMKCQIAYQVWAEKKREWRIRCR